MSYQKFWLTVGRINDDIFTDSKSSYGYKTDINNISTVSDILVELDKHEQVLLGTDIEQLLYFSRTYIITNLAIDQARANGYFANPELVQKLQLHFAHIYFEMLNDYAMTGQLPRQWHWASTHWSARWRPAGLSLYLAIRAHIQCDAPLALRRLLATSDSLADDYMRIENLLLRASQEIVVSYSPNPLLRPIRELARKLLIAPISLMIFGWRRDVWRTYSYEIFVTPRVRPSFLSLRVRPIPTTTACVAIDKSVPCGQRALRLDRPGLKSLVECRLSGLQPK